MKILNSLLIGTASVLFSSIGLVVAEEAPTTQQQIRMSAEDHQRLQSQIDPGSNSGNRSDNRPRSSSYGEGYESRNGGQGSKNGGGSGKGKQGGGRH